MAPVPHPASGGYFELSPDAGIALADEAVEEDHAAFDGDVRRVSHGWTARSQASRIAAAALAVMLVSIGAVLFVTLGRQGLEAAASGDTISASAQSHCPAGHSATNCLEYGKPDADCCAMPGDGGCANGPAKPGAVCYSNGAVTTCCPFATSSQAITEKSAQQTEICPVGTVATGCLEKGRPDEDCCSMQEDAGCRGGQSPVAGNVCFGNGAVTTCCPKPLGEPPLCPKGYAQAGCLNNDTADHKCCAEAGTAECEEGSEYVAGEVCHPSGRVATCCSSPSLPTTQDAGLFCFSVVPASGPEAGLMKEHHFFKQGVFACDKYSVFSDGQIDPVPVEVIHPAREQSTVFWGAWAKATLLRRAWDVAFSEGQWAIHAWTVRADADVAWFPDRLRTLLNQRDFKEAQFVRGADAGASAVLEVLSAAAMGRLASKAAAPCQIWGDGALEDAWLLKCLSTLSIAERPEESAWLGDPDECDTSKAVALRPIPNSASLQLCYTAATGN